MAGLGAGAFGRTGDVETPIAALHSSQNFAPGLFVAPHFGHTAASGAAHSLQNLAPSRFSAAHFEHRIDLS
jgi:hypothetical protein